MADDLSLLLKIRGDAAGAKQAAAETRAAIATLRQGLSNDFGQIQNVTNSVFSNIADHLNVFVGQRLPLVGGAFVRVSENLRGIGTESSKGEAALASFGKTLDNLSSSTGKSRSEITSFLTSFVQLESQAARDAAVIETFGAATAQKLIPQLEKAGEEMATVATTTEGAGAAFSGMAVPLGIVAVGFAATAAAAALLTKETFNLIESTAEFQGKLIDLSQQTGVSVETLSALEILFKTTGGDLNSATASLNIFQRKLEEAQDPLSKAAQTFSDLGVNTSDTETALRQTLATLAKLPEGYRQTALGQEVFGRGAKALLAVLKESNGDLDAQIKKFRELGILISTEDAKAADQFNDQLALLGFQGRAALAELAKGGIKPTTEAMQNLSKSFRDNKAGVDALGVAFGTIISVHLRALDGILITVSAGVNTLRDAWAGVRAAAVLAATGSLEAANATFEALKKAQASTVLTPQAAPALGITGLSPEARRTAKAQLEGLQELAAEQSRLTADEIARATVIERNSNLVIAALKKERDARFEAIDAEVAFNKQVADTRRQAGDTSAAEELEKKNRALLQQRRDTESEFNRKSIEEDRATQIERNKNFIEHQNARTELIIRANDFEIKAIENRVKAGTLAELDGQKEIERIQADTLAARRTAVERELKLGGLTKEERSKLNDELAALDQERTLSEKDNAEKRKQIQQDEINFQRDLLLKRIDNELRLGDIIANARVASIKSLAALGKKTEEDAGREIGAVRLAAIDREIEAIKARQTALATIVDPKARKAAEDQLTADLKAAEAERKALREETDRNVEEGFNRDLERRRRYSEEVARLNDEIALNDLALRRRELETIAARTGLNSQIIAQFRRLTLDEAAERHNRVLDEISAQEAEAHAVDVGNKHQLEIEQQYNKLREQENERFHKQQEDINKPGGAGVSGRAAPTAISQLLTGLTEKFSGNQLKIAQAGIEALAGAFQTLGEAVGQAVEAWVLYGKAGVSIRQVTAQVLASVAQQAAIKAVFELAEGFAALALAFFGIPNAGPSAQAHFTAAAIYGSIAGVAAVAGRGIAENSFQQSPSSFGSAGRGTSTPEPTTITTARNQAQKIIIVIRPDGTKFADAVTAHIETNVGDAGRLRELILTDGR